MDENTRSYDRVAALWDERRRARGLDESVADLALRLTAGARVLDVGCGAGYPIDAYLCGRGCAVVGIDPSAEMLALARRLNLPGARFMQTGFLEYRAGAAFDAVIAFDSLWHIPLADQRRIYSAAASLLRPGGYFLFTHGRREGNVTGEMLGASFIYSALDGAEVRLLLREARLGILRWEEDYEHPTTGTRELLVLAQRR